MLKLQLQNAITFLFSFVIWELLSFVLGPDKLPHVHQILSAMVNSITSNPIIQAQGGGDSGYLPHMLFTTQTFLLGLILGIIIGFSLAVMVFQFPLILSLFDPILEMLRVIPPLIIIPFVLIILPANESNQVLIGGLYAAYSICVYTLNALQNIDKKYYCMAMVYRATRLQRIRTVQIPAVLSELVGGLRVTSALTMGIIIVAEYLGSPSGIGRVLKYALSYTDIELIMVGIFWSVIIAIFVDSAIVFSFHFLLRWSIRSIRTL